MFPVFIKPMGIFSIGVLLLFTGGNIMADEGQGNYLSDSATVNTIYGYLEDNQLDSAVAHIKGLGDDQTVAQTWINVQCDINNIKQDPKLSAQIGNAGVDFMMEKGFKGGAAMLLHNISAFFMPEWDENVDAAAIPIIVDAARRQIPLRQERAEEQPGPLMWAYWDLGMAELVAGNAEGAITAFSEGVKVADKQGDANGAAWCNIFMGKTKVKLVPDQKADGETMMRDAAKVIMDTGQDWEKDSIPGILLSAGLE
jgi:hypothetical protein